MELRYNDHLIRKTLSQRTRTITFRTIKYEFMTCILVKATFVFGFSNMRHILPLQADYVKTKIIYDEFFLHNHDLKMKSKNFLVKGILIQILLDLDLQ